MKGKKRKRIRFSHMELAETRGVTVYAVYRAIQRGTLDITDIKSFCRYALKIKQPSLPELTKL
jgi:hypothetical protein